MYFILILIKQIIATPAFYIFAFFRHALAFPKRRKKFSVSSQSAKIINKISNCILDSWVMTGPLLIHCSYPELCMRLNVSFLGNSTGVINTALANLIPVMLFTSSPFTFLPLPRASSPQ